MPRAFIQRNMNTDDITLTVNAIQIFLLYTGNVKRLMAIAQDVHMKGITIRRNLFPYVSETNDSDVYLGFHFSVLSCVDFRRTLYNGSYG